LAPDDKGQSVALVEHMRAELADGAQVAVAYCPESAIALVD
jgi:ferredoxin